MRGDVERQTMILSAGTPDQLIPDDHPIRLIKPMSTGPWLSCPPPSAACTPRWDAPPFLPNTC